MKRLICAVMLAMFSAAVIGCEASAKVGDDDRDSTHSSYKKTTVKESDGDVHTKTEIRKSN